MDISPDYVQRARERAHETGVADATTVAERDMRDLREVSGRYDLVTSLFTSFGFYDDETNRVVLVRPAAVRAGRTGGDAGAGARDVRLYASLDGDELARDSTRMVLLGRRN